MFFKNLILLIGIFLIDVILFLYCQFKSKAPILQAVINTIYLLGISINAWVLLIYLGNNKLLLSSFILLFTPLFFNVLAFPITNILRNNFLDKNINKSHNYFKYNILSLIIMIIINILIMTSDLSDFMLLLIMFLMFTFLIILFVLPSYILFKTIITNEHLLNDIYLPKTHEYQKLHLKYVTNEKYLKLINLLNNKIIPDYIIAKEQDNKEVANKCLSIISDYLEKININRINKTDINIDEKFKYDENILKRLEEMNK